MKKIHISATTAVLLGLFTLSSEVGATDIPSPANIISADQGLPPGINLTIGSTNYWSMGGGSNNYRIYDYINGNAALVITASSQNSNSIRVESTGDIGLADNVVHIDKSANSMGIGTANPETNLHIVAHSFAANAASAEVKLEAHSDVTWTLGSDWFSPVTGGSSPVKQFFIKDDVTSTTPFAINTGAPDDSLNIASDGNVGLGTDAPSAKLDVQWNGSNTVGDGLTNLLVLSATNSETAMSSDAGFRLVNGSTSKGWNFRTNSGGDSFQATQQGTGGAEFTIKNATSNVSGTELHLGNGAKNVGGVWINASSRALKENIKELSTQDALAAFHKLQPVTYNYKSDKKEQVVGFIAEDVPELVAIQGRDGLSSMDMVAVLTKVVQEQDKSLAETKAELQANNAEMKAMRAEITELKVMKQKVAQLEILLTNLALNTNNASKEKVSMK